MPETSHRLNLPYIQASQAQKHVTHNEALALLDLLVQLVVEDFGETIPPGAPENGQIWALGAQPTGSWAGQPFKLAAWLNGGWEFLAPQEGWRATGLADGQLRLWTGTEWVLPEAAAPDLDNLSGVGVNTASDSTNRLAVSAPVTLLSHEGAGHQLKINKAASGDTASLLFQTGWSGRAEMGTAGADSFSIKVSPDGAAWLNALVIAAATGIPDLRSGATIGSALAFHRQNVLGTVSQSGGVPTGAVIERGANANGAYVRFADGTQICTISGFATSASGAVDWTFPAAFIYPANPSRHTVTGMLSSSPADAATLINGGTANGTSVAISAVAGGVRVARNCNLTAVGRWF